MGWRMWSLLREDRGAAAVEAAFALPVLMVFAIAISQIGSALWIQNTLQYAVDAAARCAAIDTYNCGTTNDIKAFAVANAAPFSISSSSFTVATASCGKQVSVSYQFSSKIPGTGDWSPMLTATSCHPA